MYFGEKLKRLRKEKNLSQIDLADKVGVTRSSIANYETGRNYPANDILTKFATLFNVSIDYLVDDNFNGIPKNHIPVLGIVKAGYNYLAEENIIGYVSINDNTLDSEDFFALVVKGNSMEPIIYEKDIAIVKKQEDFENGDIVVALINGEEATIKRAYKNERGIVLQPANPMIEPLEFNKNQIVNLPIKIIGIVYNITRKFK